MIVQISWGTTYKNIGLVIEGHVKSFYLVYYICTKVAWPKWCQKDIYNDTWTFYTAGNSNDPSDESVEVNSYYWHKGFPLTLVLSLKKTLRLGEYSEFEFSDHSMYPYMKAFEGLVTSTPLIMALLP